MDEDSVALVRDRLTISEVVEVLRDPSQYSVITQPPQRPKAGHVYVFSWKDHPSQKGNCTCMHAYTQKLESFTMKVHSCCIKFTYKKILKNKIIEMV